MKQLFFTLTLIFCIQVFSQTPCSGGFASSFPCNEIDLYSNLTITQLGGTATAEGNDIWGWTDPLDNKEYAIIGLTSHTAFVDITNPTTPIYLGKLPTATVNSIWRDIKVYNNYAFIVSEASNHGMQVFDLTKLRNVVSPPVNFTQDAYYNGFGRCHNIVINEATGFAYAVGTLTFSGGPHFINIQDPLNPTAAGGYSAEAYTHDAQVVIYNGPDTEHNGKEIFFGANENQVVVVDVSNKANPILLSTFTYTNADYVHQGWLTDDQKYFILGDETDESTYGFNTKSVIIDMSNLDNPVLKTNYFGPTNAIDHNGYVDGNDFYLANYRAGLRIIDIADIDNGNLNEVAFFDTYPTSNTANYNGAWSVYPYFASGSIIVSDIERGLFVLKKSNTLSSNTFNENEFRVYVDNKSNLLKIEASNEIDEVCMYNILGSQVKNGNGNKLLTLDLDISDLNSGVYIVKINNATTKKIVIN
ncbi:choice-of-anchor B family protein [Flavobacterium okayamense]|uniref:Secretion system C-terminal sorting domain-containing protein n=1 Tax=Flavobacterium okayamense TaxID=2830782 RepID=A0ABM7S940_9FLAO|nr:choice-of-anchor B family protein [Flavobacterium okayamense]BCY29478.1 hypothetical protein KK2020170_23460 [Flavobacterium okayamense]